MSDEEETRVGDFWRNLNFWKFCYGGACSVFETFCRFWNAVSRRDLLSQIARCIVVAHSVFVEKVRWAVGAGMSFCSFSQSSLLGRAKDCFWSAVGCLLNFDLAKVVHSIKDDLLGFYFDYKGVVAGSNLS